MSQNPKAFTLIELLIVVAIIAILAAIAVPNFLEAQTRAKVSRVRADMRSIATALESYRVDSNNYPGPYDYNDPPSDGWGGFSQNSGAPGDSGFHARVSSSLTTPIAYIASLPLDAFDSSQTDNTMPQETWNRFRYWNFPYFRENPVYANLGPTTGFGRNEAAAGQWLFYSIGPDQDQGNEGAGFHVDYDPTNGTLSIGNIFRTQKNGEVLGRQ